MDGVGTGSVLGGRYTTDRRIGARYGVERWTAHDATLGRHIEVLCLPADDARSAPLLDAARRAAAVDSSRLARILDVGRDEALAFVVEEDLTDCTTLTDLVEAGGLPADEVRRITGEVATALDAAAQRGLHHLALTPDDVLRTPDGEIKLRGVATAGVIARTDDVEADQASRTDAVGVVAITYAGLTGLWPRHDDIAGMAPAPRIAGAWAAPSELASGVPRDLDALCRLTLNEDQGPVSPGDFASQIAPWPSTPVVLPARTTPADGVSGATATGSTGESGETGDTAEQTVVLPVRSAGEDHVAGGSADRPRPGRARAAALAGGAAGAGAMGRATDRLTSAARTVSQRAATLTANDDEDAPAPMMPSEPLNRDESRLALVIVAVFVVAALIVGLVGVSRIGSHSTVDFSSGATDGGATTSASASPSGSSEPSPSSSEGSTGLEPLAILSADGFDPLGDQQENNSQAAKVFDGDPKTEWTSERYNTAELGGLKKGVGVIVDLGPNVTAKEIQLILPNAADVTVYVSDERSLSKATAIGEKKDAQGTVTFPVKGNAKGQYVIVWFTKLTKDANGEYRAHLAEVIPRG